MSGLPAVPKIQFSPLASLSTLEFWWEAPLNNGGALIQDYTLLCSSIPFSTIIGPSSFYAKVTPLVNTQDYTFQLAASNTNGRGPYIAFTTAQPGIRPGGATNLTVNVINATTANVTWNFSTNIRESGNHYFVMTVIPSTITPQISTFQIPIYPNQTSQLVSNLSSTYYTFLLQSSNDANYSFPNLSTIQHITVPMPAVFLSAIQYSGTGLWLDQSGNGNNATCSGTPAKNAGGNGISFNGTAFWSFPNINAGNAWSVSVWVRNISLNSAAILTQNTGGNLNINVASPDTGALNVGFYNGSWRTGQNTPLSATVNTWVCVQGTWDGTTLTSYINGASIGTITPGGVSIDGNVTYVIGRRYNGSQVMTGEVGEVRIYKSVLTPTQIASVYSGAVATFAS